MEPNTKADATDVLGGSGLDILGSLAAPAPEVEATPLNATFAPNTPVRRRPQCKSRLARTPWSEAMDALLMDLVKELGVGRWPEIAKRLSIAAPDELRTGKQVRHHPLPVCRPRCP